MTFCFRCINYSTIISISSKKRSKILVICCDMSMLLETKNEQPNPYYQSCNSHIREKIPYLVFHIINFCASIKTHEGFQLISRNIARNISDPHISGITMSSTSAARIYSLNLVLPRSSVYNARHLRLKFSMIVD